ncbi:mucin-5AC-like [Sinocyclocheilus grahami]|uniref:mucin-5AC-like n=1 Tax=Sinocyclocheilus grahami TaxID=75366 RepID=UPI0007ACA880|nr:PREDICTED: mucin-5AC-like [Sinocyclocheilus grahami]
MGRRTRIVIWMLDWIVLYFGLNATQTEWDLFKSPALLFQFYAFYCDHKPEIQYVVKQSLRKALGFPLTSAHNKQVCSTWGNYHFKTFDGDIFHLPSTCNYIMCAMCGSSYEDFNIQLRRQVVNDQPIITNITMKLDSTVVELTKNSVTVDGRVMNLPFSHSGILIYKSSSYVKVTAKHGLVAMWNEDDSFTVELDMMHLNKTCGLCGDFNGIQLHNEFIKDACPQPTVFFDCTSAAPESTGSECQKSCSTLALSASPAVCVRLGWYQMNKEVKLTDGGYQILHRDGGVDIPYQILIRGIYMVIEANNGLIVMWDQRANMFIKLSPNFKGAVCGLCGNFDGNSNNDFMLRSQEVVVKPLDFGNDWKESNSCPVTMEMRNPCSNNPYRKSWAQKECSIITSGVFTTCHSQVDPNHFYDACVRDSCACDSGGDHDCLCAAVAAYAQACNEAGACVAWRTPKICPLFCDYYNAPGKCEWQYKPCGAPCLQTCRNPTGQCSSQILALEVVKYSSYNSVLNKHAHTTKYNINSPKFLHRYKYIHRHINNNFYWYTFTNFSNHHAYNTNEDINKPYFFNKHKHISNDFHNFFCYTFTFINKQIYTKCYTTSPEFPHCSEFLQYDRHNYNSNNKNIYSSINNLSNIHNIENKHPYSYPWMYLPLVCLECLWGPNNRS